MATTGTEEAEKAFRSAEERFLAGDLDGALRVARNAKRHSASLPALQSALTAYEVHVAADGGRNCWYAVLGVGGGRPEPVPHEHDAIKNRYRRLCLVLHPDKNRSAAADGAFKLLQRAWEVLSARQPPRTGSDDPGPEPEPKPKPKPRPRPRPPPAEAPGPDWWSTFFGNSPPPDDPDWWSSFFRDSSPAGAPPGRDWWSSFFRYKPPPERTWSSYGYTPPPPPPPPFSSSSSGDADFNAWRSRYARKSGTAAYCGHCGGSDSESSSGGHRTVPGGRCHACGTPRQSEAEGASAPPPAGAAADGGDGKFACPTECCRCKTPFSSPVCPGMCKLRCHACSYDAYVYVYDRHRATAF